MQIMGWLLCVALGCADAVAPVVETVASVPAAEDSKATVPQLLPRDTPVELMAVTEVRTDKVSPGTQFRLRLNKPVMLGSAVIVPVGATAYGEVVASSAAGGLGQTGKLQARLLYLEHQGLRIPLEGEVSAKGQGGGSAAVATILAGPVGLFHRGNNAKIKGGEIIVAFVAQDVPLTNAVKPADAR